MRFQTFFEAREENIVKIQNAIDKVEDRPFKELFGDKERFLVKVYNPEFQNGMRIIQVNPKLIDWEKRVVDDNGKKVPIPTFLKNKFEENEKSKMSLEEIVEDIKHGDDDKIKELLKDWRSQIVIEHPTLENWVGGLLNVKSRYRKDMGLFHPEDIVGLPEKDWTLKDAEIYMDAILKGKSEMTEWVESKDWEIYAKQTQMNHYGTIRQRRMHLRKIKQMIDQNNIFYYLLFSRHPIDVLRMSDHKGISSCHHLDGSGYGSEEGGSYVHCAYADASNDAGVIYLIRGSQGNKIANRLNDKEVFKDKDRDVDGVQPVGRVRIRRFIDTATEKDFAVLAKFMTEQKYGQFTKDLWDKANSYIREHQSIYNNPPDADYAYKNIVMAGGEYTDNASPAVLMNMFFGKNLYSDKIRLKNKGMNVATWTDELDQIIANYRRLLDNYLAEVYYEINDDDVDIQIAWKNEVNWEEDWDVSGDDFNYQLFDNILNNEHETSIHNRIIRQSEDKITGVKSVDTRYSVVYNCDVDKLVFHVNRSCSIEDPADLAHILERLFLYKVISKINESIFSYIYESFEEHKEKLVKVG